MAHGWNGPSRPDAARQFQQPIDELLALLQPRPGERILDAGCGSGDLTARIAASGAAVQGIDSSAEAIARARVQHPQLDLQVSDLTSYRSAHPYDAVFSHAVLHWVADAEAAAASIRLALRPGGRFVAEFAGQGNTAAILTGLEQVLTSQGYAWEGRNPWYHPTIGQYASLLERIGFRVTYAQHTGHARPLQGEDGLQRWLASFSSVLLPDLSPPEQAAIIQNVEDRLRPQLYDGERWMIDISRLRISAVRVR
ncbi:class I SAM-dependent methyltransferase [Paenibacillus sp. 1P07SE]|uniref:class I SAM-dependent methyltransferase n=1 Tax=Paenibacillus sp. 1P07SE TaxID=3132209 RepID=UPI0039A4774F